MHSATRFSDIEQFLAIQYAQFTSLLELDSDLPGIYSIKSMT